MPVSHKFQSARPDNGDPGDIQPSQWNDDHDLDGMLALLDTVAPSPNTVVTVNGSNQLVLVATATFAQTYSAQLTGVPTAPTAAQTVNSTQIATTEYVRTAVTNLTGGAPGALDTLKELADAINDDASYAAGVTASLAVRLRVDAAQGLNSTQKAQGVANLGLSTVAVTGNYADLAGKPTLGTAAALNVGTAANQVVQLDNNAKLPAIDGSKLTGIVAQFAPSNGFVNKFRNGTMDIWQRGVNLTPAAATSGGLPTADGWVVSWAASSAAAPTITPGTARQLTRYSQKIAGAANITGFNLRQRIESFIAAPLSGRQVTVQAWIYNSTGASITPSLTVRHPTTADAFDSGTADDLSTTALQPCANNAWTQVAYTFPMGLLASNGVEALFSFGALGSGAYVQIAECDIRATDGVATGLNAGPPVAELRPAAVETLFCQRYYVQIAAALNQVFCSGVFNPSNICATRPLPVAMRSNPNVGFSNLAAFTLYNGVTFYPLLASNMSADTQTVYFANQPSSGTLPAGAGVIIGTATPGYFWASAEL